MQTSTTSTISNTLSHQTESDTTFHYSSDFLEWLRKEEISLAVSTYQTNKLFLIGRDTTKHLFVSEKSFDRAMGLHVESENSFYLSTRFLLWRFENALAEGQTHKEADKVYIPRQAFNTGDLNIHDVSVDKNGETVFVNTRYNCIAKISEKYNFKPLWMPPFINKMVAEDRCHLNGMAMRDGKPRYVTAISQSNLLDSWREHRQDGGVVMDMETSKVLVDGLSMPHSPRYYQDKIWVLNAGRGEFGYVENNTFIAITKLDGFLRGLAFHKNYAIIGLSKPRHERTFTGLPLDEILQGRNTEPQCGFWIVDINTGEIIHKFEIQGKVVELYDVQVLPNVKRPLALDLTSTDVTRYISIEGDDDTVDFKALVSLEKEDTKVQSPYHRETSTENPIISNLEIKSPLTNHLDPNLSATSKEAITYQITTLRTEQVLKEFTNLTFPRFDQQILVRQFNEPLLMVVARNAQQYIGAVLIESYSKGVGQILSWYVLPPFRELGIGKELLNKCEKVLRQNNFNSVQVKYRSDWKSIDKIKSILENNNWLESQTISTLYKVHLEDVAKASWIRQNYNNPQIEMFLWNELTPKEKQQILDKQSNKEWYPTTVNPFAKEHRVDNLSFGLRYKNEVFGWLITKSVKSNTLEFAHLFVDTKIVGNELSNYTIFLSILSNVIVKSSEEGYKYGLFQVENGNDTMYKFVDRYLKPYLINSADTIISGKELETDNSKTNITYKVHHIDIDTTISHFNQLTFPRLDELRLVQEFKNPLLVVVAQNNEQPVGLTVLDIQPDRVAQLVSWQVAPSFRNLGIGKELLRKTEKILRQNKLNSIYAKYRSDWNSVPTFEHILATKKWEAPQTKLYFCKSSMDIMLKAPWMTELELPEGMELFLWKNLTQEEKKQIIHKKQTQDWYPTHLDPFQHEDKMDLTSSTGLRYKGEVIGWMITHRLKPDTVEFTAAFVDENATGLRKQSLFLPVLAKSIHFVNEEGIKYGIWQMQVNNSSMQKFLDKFLKPYLISFTESKVIYKVL
jgi:uncharacterized protein (TIGR03032 family)